MVVVSMLDHTLRFIRLYSSAASNVYKRQLLNTINLKKVVRRFWPFYEVYGFRDPVSYTHFRAHETPDHRVCRLLLEKKSFNKNIILVISFNPLI